MSADSSPINVRYAAQLARLALSEEELAKYQGQLGQVLEYVGAMEKVDVSGVEPAAHLSAVYNVTRDDVARESFTAEEALANAPAQARGLFIVPKVIE